MARVGVSYESVATAAQALVDEGRKVTLSAVRERMGGTGSMNTIHRHWTVWQGQQKAAPRKVGEPNTRLIAALGQELSKAAEEAASDAEASLAQAMSELATFAANGEALEAERDAIAGQLAEVARERDLAVGKGIEQQAEIVRLNNELELERAEVAKLRRHLAQADLRLEAVPRLEAEVASTRLQAGSDVATRATAEKQSAVAEANRVAAVTAQQLAEARLQSADAREAELRLALSNATNEHLATSGRLVTAAAQAAAAQAELDALRKQVAATEAAHATADGEKSKGAPATKKATGGAKP